MKRNYSDKEMINILESVAFPQGLTFQQSFIFAYWTMFNRKKAESFCYELEIGKAPKFAFRDTIKSNK